MTATAPPDPDTLVAEARGRQKAACDALLAAEADPASVTPARLSELRQEADHAQLLVPAAERQAATLRAEQREAAKAAILDRIRTEAASDLDRADEISDALTAFETATKRLCEVVHTHNERIGYWSREMQKAGIRATKSEGTGADAIAHQVPDTFQELPAGVTLGHKVYRPMRGAQLIGAAVFRALQQYPLEFRRYGVHLELVDEDLPARGRPVDPENGRRVDLPAWIRRDA